MNRVDMFAYGYRITVDEDQVDLHEKKNNALKAISALEAVFESIPADTKLVIKKLMSEQNSIIIRLNRKIRRTVAVHEMVKS